MIELDIHQFEQYLFKKTIVSNYIQYIFRFPNNYGASLVSHRGSDWEMALISFDDNGWHLIYEKDFEVDTLRWLTDHDVTELLRKIMHYETSSDC